MNVVLVALHVIVCLFLIAVVLLQRGKTGRKKKRVIEFR